MQVSRRGFLGGMLALAAVAAAPTMSAAEVKRVPNKYREALRLYDACVPVAGNSKEVNKRYNLLLTYLHDNFTPPEANAATVQATRKVLQEFNSLDVRGIPPNVADEVYPIALTKMALTQDRMALDPDLLTQFDEFHKRYGRLIHEACS